jgi:hypothetical protein
VAEEGETAGSTQAKKRTLPVHFIINRFYDQNVSRLFPLVGHVARKYPGVLCKGDVRIFLNMHYRPDKYDVKVGHIRFSFFL